MKDLNASGNLIIEGLAQLALHERVQAMFDIYPGQLVKDIQKFARIVSRDPHRLVNELRVYVPQEFDIVLAVVSMSLGGQKVDCAVTDRPYSRVIRERFRLNPVKMVRDYPKKAKAIGLDVQDIIQALREIVPIVIQWAFDEVEKILDKQGVR